MIKSLQYSVEQRTENPFVGGEMEFMPKFFVGNSARFLGAILPTIALYYYSSPIII
ncbi:hypothetical protein ACFLS9_09915 [Bacteroidota bacterium]